MLVSAITDPTAFRQACFATERYRENAEVFLRGMRTNGLLIVDSAGRLKDSLIHEIESLPIKWGQHLKILLEDLLKNKRKRFVHVHPNVCEIKSNYDQVEAACMLKKACDVDALIVSEETLVGLKKTGGIKKDVIPLAEYIISDFENLRRHMSEELPPMDLLPESEFKDIIIRIIRYGRWVRFYDKQIGKGNNTSYFRKGIGFILGLFREHGHFASRGEAKIEIITCQKECIYSDDTLYEQKRKGEVNRQAYDKVVRELIDPLRREFNWAIELKVKNDSRGIFHARHLEAQTAIVQFDPGFDIFRPDNTLKRVLLKLANGDYEHLKECRNLEDVRFE